MESTNFFTEDYHCLECKGECWKGKDNVATQRATLVRFGVIPNNCINGSDGTVHCPYNRYS